VSGDTYRCFDVTEPVSYCAVADERVFPGVVALLNSLRLTGHREPVHVLDAGLTTEQRRLLAPQCCLATPALGMPTHPGLLKPFIAPPDFEGVLVFLDSDLIVTGSLAPVVAAAADGGVCAFPDPDQGRYFDEWREIFGIRAELRRQTYVSSHFVAFSTVAWPDLLPRWGELCARIFDRDVFTDDPDSPVDAADQDALNALLMSEMPAHATRLLPARSRVQGPLEARRTRILDRASLSCEHARHRPLVIHIGGKRIPKPWQPAARPWVRRDAYTRFLRRLLHGRDVVLPLASYSALPPWLSEGAVGASVLLALSAAHATRDPAVRAEATRLLPASLRRTLRGRQGDRV